MGLVRASRKESPSVPGNFMVNSSHGLSTQKTINTLHLLDLHLQKKCHSYVHIFQKSIIRRDSSAVRSSTKPPLIAEEKAFLNKAGAPIPTSPKVFLLFPIHRRLASLQITLQTTTSYRPA